MNKRSPRLFFAPNGNHEAGLTLLELLTVLVIAPVLIFSSSVMYLKTVQITKAVHDRSQALMERQLVLDYLRRTVPNGSTATCLPSADSNGCVDSPQGSEVFHYGLRVTLRDGTLHDYNFLQPDADSAPRLVINVTPSGGGTPPPPIVLSYTGTIRPPASARPFSISGSRVMFNFNFDTKALDPSHQLIPASASIQLRGGL